MISKEEVQKLAELVRLKLTEEETGSLQRDISSILDYVGQVSAVSQGDTLASGLSKVSPLNRNVMRADEPRGENDPLLGKRDHVLNALPKRRGDFNVVRKIIQKDE